MSLESARSVLLQRDADTQKAIIVLTDGNETCNGEPGEIARQLRNLGINVNIHVVGFAVTAEEEVQLRSIAENGEGTYVAAADAESLNSVLQTVVTIATAPAPTTNAFFEDNFDGESLGERWSVRNEDDESCIVEDGKLLIVADQPASLNEAEKMRNLFTLNTPLPRGDWILSARCIVDVQTAHENLFPGLYEDMDNYIVANTSFNSTYYYEQAGMTSGAHKRAKGKDTTFNKDVWRHPNTKTTTVAEQATGLNTPFIVRLKKVGRSYYVSVLQEQENKASEWVEMEKLTSLRAKGQFVLGFSLNKKVAGEGTAEIDWVKVETLN